MSELPRATPSREALSRAALSRAALSRADLSRAALSRAAWAAVYGLYFLSGASALVYQVVWVRQLGLVLGVTAHALATVLAAFMGGLALGGWLFGRLAARTPRRLRLFGGLEVGIGLSALALPAAFAALAGGVPELYRLAAASPALFAALRFAAVGALLVVPCTLMGGTVAVLAGLQSRGDETLGRDVGLLYAVNTLGAVAGALAAGFVLLPELGVRETTLTAVTLSVGVGSLALLLDRRLERRPPSAAAAEAALPRPWGPPAFSRTVLGVAAVSGFCALGYEVLWARTLVFYLHNSTYATTAMLACFLAGIGVGSLVPLGRLDRSPRPDLWLAGAQLLVGGLTLVSLRLYPHLPAVLGVLGDGGVDAWWKAIAVQLAQAALVLVPPALAMGATFPIAVRLLGGRRTVGREVGTLYAVNTAGAVAGSLAAAYVLLPRLGLAGGFRALVALNLAAGLWTVAASPARGRAARRAVLAAAVAAAALLAVAVPGDLFRRAFARGVEILFYRDGATDTVMVKARSREAPERALYFSDGRGTAGTLTNAENRVYGHLPMLLHGEARRVLSIAFGVGNTVAAILTHPGVERVDVVELSPNVLAAAPYFPTNDRAWEDPRVRFHVEDGRTYLLATEARYDVIQLEPPEIHTDGVVYLYTREFYRLARRRLAPGGLVCQWANVAMMPLREQKMLIRTFLEVFPEGTVWMPRLTAGYVLLIGGPDELRIDVGRFARAFAAEPVRRDLEENVGVRSLLELLASFRLGPEGARRFTAGVPIVTDDRTRVDFSTPRSPDANYGLSNNFSGLTVPAFLPGGWPATRAYQAAKLRAIAASKESVVPYLEGFSSPAERREVEARLEAMERRFHEVMARRIAELERAPSPLVNT